MSTKLYKAIIQGQQVFIQADSKEKLLLRILAIEETLKEEAKPTVEAALLPYLVEEVG